MTEYKTRDYMRRKIDSIHFVGIGGIGMSGIAEVLLNMGYRVSGSDLQKTEVTEHLESMGVRVNYGHDVGNLGDAQVVVTSTAILSDNPEVLEAKARGIPVIPRAEMLAELLKMKASVAVSGCHGKTTTTSMVASILSSGGLDPTMVVGGKLHGIGSNARLGGGDIIVAEADESDGSFLRLAPLIAVITNIDREHIDYYRDLDQIKDAFVRFANSVPFYGVAVVCSDCPHVRDILPRIQRRIVTYGTAEEASYRASGISFEGMRSSFRLSCEGEDRGIIHLRVPGGYNVNNALAAIAVARELDMDFPLIKKGIADFKGVHRRLEVKGSQKGVLVVDDYGHHPTEIRETLKAARRIWKGRIIVVFQPHRYTRTEALVEEFADAFHDADRVYIADIYSAGERVIPGVHASIIEKAVERAGHPYVKYLGGFDEILETLRSETYSTDTIITFGAGNVWKVGEAFLEDET